MNCTIDIEPVPGKLRTKAEFGRTAESIETVRGYRAKIFDADRNPLYATSVCLTEVIAERAAHAWIRANRPPASAAA